MLGRDTAVTVPRKSARLVEGFAGEPLDLLADIAADHVAERVAERTGRAGKCAARLEGAVEPGAHDQGVGPAADGERSTRDGEIELGRLQQLRHWILRMPGKIARRLRLQRVADRRHGDGRRRKHGRGAGERRQRRHRHKLRSPFLEGRRPDQVHQQRRADEGGDDNGNAENDDAKIHCALQTRHTRDRPACACGSAA